MAPKDGTTTTRLGNALVSRSSEFSFFQAARLLEHARPDAAAIGYLGPAEKEALRVRPALSLAFPSSDVESIEPPGSDTNPVGSYRITVTFMGLYGASSPLPAFYSEEILWDGEDENAGRDLLDVFHHRYLSLFYRSWQKYRYYLQYERGAHDSFSRALLSLVGLGHLELGHDTRLNGDRLLAYLGLLSMRSHSASVVAGIVSHYFDGVRVQVKQCVKRRVDIPAYQRNRLGVTNTSLGGDSMLGSTALDNSGKFRLQLGPLSGTEFFEYLPSGAHYAPLRELLSLVLSDLLEFDVELLPDPDELPHLDLAHDNPCRLGWSSWLGHHTGTQPSVVLSRHQGY